jgi:Protein of unknown function (DUF2800)
MKKGHKDRAHALLSASGSSRWLNCTPSAKLEDLEPKQSSVYADEGTLAHEISETLLRYYLNKINRNALEKELEKHRAHKLYNTEMDEYCQIYVDYVQNEHIAKKPYSTLLIEQKLDLTRYVPESFGTVDAVILSKGQIEVIDLKYGKGVRVDVFENSQLKLYALGAIAAYEFMEDFDTIKVTIVQPRMDSISSQEYDVKELLAWGENFVQVQADLAMQGLGEFTPGSWCKFCKIQYKCPAMANITHELAVEDFQGYTELLSDAEMLELYKKADLAAAFIGNLKKFVFNEALKGKNWEGFKLVEGRSNRKVIDEIGLIENILENRKTILREELLNEKLKSFADLTAVLGKASFQALVEPYLTKPPGAPTLVPVSDKRPAWSSVESDFSEAFEPFDLDF